MYKYVVFKEIELSFGHLTIDQIVCLLSLLLMESIKICLFLLFCLYENVFQNDFDDEMKVK